MKYWPHWGSHIPLLIKAMQMTSGDVLELGMGFASTPLLHWMCLDMGRKLVSYESEKEWVEMHKHFKKPFHEIYHIENWLEADIKKAWSVALVDQSPARRRKDTAKMLANHAELVLCHDTQPEDNHFYKYHWAFDMYKWQWTYKKDKPWTTVLSNFINVAEVFK